MRTIEKGVKRQRNSFLYTRDESAKGDGEVSSFDSDEVEGEDGSIDLKNVLIAPFTTISDGLCIFYSIIDVVHYKLRL